MSKKYYRFFGGLLTAQEHWLNKMSEKGYRLIRAEKMLYEFEECKPDQVKYCVEFIGQKSKANASDYHEFLEGMGYKVFYKNINLNYSVGKVRLRPWAEKGGRIATNATTFNRELLIVEKDNDGKPFELHTSYEDKENYYRNLRNPWLLILLMFAIFAVAKCSVVFGVLALVSLIPVLVYQTQVMQNKRDKGDQTIVEWYFKNEMNNGSIEEFDGISLVEWTEDNKIKALKEFGCNRNTYNPYQEGDTPQFKAEKANWF